MIDIAAENNDQTTDDFLKDVDIVRDIISQTDLGVFLTMLAIIGGSIAMAFVHIPHMASGPPLSPGSPSSFRGRSSW